MRDTPCKCGAGDREHIEIAGRHGKTILLCPVAMFRADYEAYQAGEAASPAGERTNSIPQNDPRKDGIEK